MPISEAQGLSGKTDTVDYPSLPELRDSNFTSPRHGPLDEEWQDDTRHSDPNPRSPKRRRLSVEVEESDQDEELDIAAAAARAFAISLGPSHSDISTPPVAQPVQRVHSTHSHPSIAPQTPPSGSDQRVRVDRLPVLNDLATQILAFLAKLNNAEIGEMLFAPPSPRTHEYRSLKARFEEAKRPFITNSPFLSPFTLDIRENGQIDMLRNANMATFMSSIFSGEIGLRIMDMNFVDVFVPENGRLLKAQGSIYLELKTQAFMAAMRTTSTSLDHIMLDLFPADMEKYLLQKRSGAKSLAPSEQDFLKRLASRRDILHADMKNNKLDGLKDRYRWDDFSREVSIYLSKNFDASTLTKDKSDFPSPTPAHLQMEQGQMENQFSIHTPPTTSTTNHLRSPFPAEEEIADDDSINLDDFVAQAARAAEFAMQTNTDMAGFSTHSLTPLPTSLPPSQPAAATAIESNRSNQPVQTKFRNYTPTGAGLGSRQSGASPSSDSEVPHSSQTAPTQVLYERARQVTTNKASNMARKPVLPSTRRPWTHEEENALMTGLDQVKGPHWSQILAMYGPGGTINESLKDRNQVQLKDKARNLKLFFLKARIEVPYYLQYVTGDLKTRAPGQAEKREAKERGRQLEESKAQIDELPMLGSPTEEAEVVSTDADFPQPVSETSMKVEQNGRSDLEGDEDEEDELDMEAIIARAAASASQPISRDDWGVI